MTMARRRLLDDTFKKSVVGNPAIATDSLARMYPGIVMNGWTTQDGTPTPETQVPIVSAGTQNQDTGKWEYEVEVGCGNLMEPREETNEKTTVVNNVSIQQKNMEFTISGISNAGGERGNTFGKASLNPGNYIASMYGNIENNLTPIVNYANGQFLSDFGKIFAIVEKTDITFGFNLKQDVSYEENVKIILNPGSTALPYTTYRPPQTVTLTADRPLTKWDKLEKRNGQWGWVYKSAEIESYTDESVPSEYYSTTGQLSVGAQVWYETDTETFVPLTTAEQEAMNALHTYRPTTVLSNQQDCQMTLTYKTRKGVGGGNLLDYRNLVNPVYWIGKTNFYVHFDITLKSNTTYRLSCIANNMNKSYYDAHPGTPDSSLYLGEVENAFNGNVGFGNTSSYKIAKTEYEFTTTENPYYINLYVKNFSQENLHIVFDELLPGLKLQEVN